MTSGDRVIVFDTDGTLMDGRVVVLDAVASALAATYEHFELPLPELDRERMGLAMGLPASAFFRTAFDPATVPADMQNAFVGEFEVKSIRAEVAALRRGESHLYPGVPETLEALAGRGLALVLYSNTTRPYFDTVVEVHGLDRWFSRTLCLEDAMRRRLARDKAGMIRHLSRGYRHVVVVGDRVHDIEAGQEAGALTVGCRYGFGAPDEFADADWCIDELSELQGLPCVQDGNSDEARG